MNEQTDLVVHHRVEFQLKTELELVYGASSEIDQGFAGIDAERFSCEHHQAVDGARDGRCRTLWKGGSVVILDLLGCFVSKNLQYRRVIQKSYPDTYIKAISAAGVYILPV